MHPTDPFAALYGAESFFNQGVAVSSGGSVGRTDDVLQRRPDGEVRLRSRPGEHRACAPTPSTSSTTTPTTEVDELADEESGAINTTFLDATRFHGRGG